MGIPRAPVTPVSHKMPVGMLHARAAAVVPPPPVGVPEAPAAAVHGTPMGQRPAQAVPVQPPQVVAATPIVARGVPPAQAALLPPVLLVGVPPSPGARASYAAPAGTHQAHATEVLPPPAEVHQVPVMPLHPAQVGLTPLQLRQCSPHTWQRRLM